MGKHIKTITFRLRYRDGEMILPINPGNIEVQRSSSSQKEDIIGIGETAIPKYTSLAKISIDSKFYRYLIDASPSSHQFTTTKGYADWFKTWQRSKLPAQWTVEELGYNLYVLCEDFDYDVRAGEEDDVYYKLSLIEYRPYGAKTIEINGQGATQTNQVTQIVTPEVPQRVDTSVPIDQTYTTMPGDSIASISRKLSGETESWPDLYEENKEQIADNIMNLSPGSILNVPKKWQTGKR